MVLWDHELRGGAISYFAFGRGVILGTDDPIDVRHVPSSMAECREKRGVGRFRKV